MRFNDRRTIFYFKEGLEAGYNECVFALKEEL